MASSFTLITLFSLALFASFIEARKDSGEYWQAVAKDQPLLEAIQHLGRADSSVVSLKKSDCHTSNNNQKKLFAKDLGPWPNLSAYGNDAKLKEENTFMKDFEPRPNLSSYHDDDAILKEEKSFIKDFEPRPNISVYQE